MRDLAASIPSALGLFGTGLSQHARLITIASAQKSHLPESLLVEQLTGHEGVNQLFYFKVDALSVSADLDLIPFKGEEISLKLLQADGSRRAWHGICTHAGCIGSDGGVARYRLILEPALTLLNGRSDNFIFQDKNAQQIVTELLKAYPQVRFEFDLNHTLALKPICTQYRESDLDFLVRLLAMEGLSWRFEHEQGDASAPASSSVQAKHRLVIFDSSAVAPAMPGAVELRFHGVRSSDQVDAIDRFTALRTVQSNAVAISSWDPQQLAAPAAEHTSGLASGDMPSLPVHDGSGERRHLDGAGASRHSLLVLQSLELANKTFAGAGAVRQLAAGHAFRLTQHGHYADNADRFTVLTVQHHARNNFDPALAGAGARGGRLEAGTYRNQFTCVRDTVAIVPRAMARIGPGTTLGSQSALVVGLPGAISTTGRDHHVKIQFAWQRGAAPNPGGLAHAADDAGNAPGNDASGTWVRVAEALAGPNWGSQFTPRIGTEVAIDFIEGDIDRPVVVAQLYTGSDLPPYSAGVDSGVNHAGVVSGLHSHNFEGGGYNQLVIDDSPGQLRTRLASSGAATQLNLGYLVQQAPESARRGSYRGSGFELRTDGWGTLRSGQGIFLSSTTRARQGASIASTQLDAADAIAQLKGAQELGKALADAATQHNALASKQANAAQGELIVHIDPKAKGVHGGAVNGQSSLQSKAGARELDAARPVEKFATSIVLLDAPSTINWATPASSVVFAGQQLQWTSQGDMQMTAGHTAAMVAANAIGLFTHAGGIQAIAGNGPLSLQAHTGQLEILADKAITVISVNDVIEIKANEQITLQAGQSSVTLEGQNITFACPGNFTVKGGMHTFDGGSRKAAELGKLPDTRVKLFDEAFIVVDKASGAPLANLPYRIRRADGTFEEGITDDQGRTHLVSYAEAEFISLELKN